jgi:hypothetical protein
MTKFSCGEYGVGKVSQGLSLVIVSMETGVCLVLEIIEIRERIYHCPVHPVVIFSSVWQVFWC